MLPNISQSEDNQAMKLGQLVEYSKRITVLQNLCRKCRGRKTKPKPKTKVTQTKD